jgi:hypothetical protein
MMMTPFKARFLAASAALCILLPLTAAAQSDFNFNTTVDFADGNPITVNVVAGCVDGTGSAADIAEADGAVPLNVAGYTDGVECLAIPSVVPQLYTVAPSAGCIIAATPVDQLDSDCTLLFELITADINITSVENSVDPVIAGSGANNIDYTFTVTNDGPGDATNVVVEWTEDWDIAGLSCTLSEPVDQDQRWTIAALANGASATQNVTCTVPAEAAVGSTYSSTWSLLSLDQVDPNAANDSSSQDSTVTREATFDVTKIWDGGEVAVQLTCGDVEVDSAITSGLAATLTVTDFADLTRCTVTETVPAGFAPGYSADCNVTGVLSGSVYSCDITNATTVARFQVTKDFSDGSTDDVEVTLTCNTGVPLEQSKTIAGGDPFGVVFVVADYIDGTMSCSVTEATNTPGYDADTSGCVWDNVMSSDSPFSCVINNTAQDATFTVYKDWEIFNEDEGGSEVIEQAHVTIWCDAEITNGGSYNDYFDEWYLEDYLGDGESLTAVVSTLTGPANCWANESIDQSGVESTGDCGSRSIPAGGNSSCTFTNTVFFEGIPTLSQYGLALMALLMLGVGMVGFRRFA